jgi:hypothetical protein
MTAPSIQGQEAARAGQPHTSCPINKPDRPAQGEEYPGPWYDWMAGWRTQRAMMGLDFSEAAAELSAFISEGLKAPVKTRNGSE